MLYFVFSDGIVGEVLFWVLRHTIGPKMYSMAVHSIWVKVYSRMLTTIVPVAISLELRGGKSKAHEERFSTSHNQDSFMFSQADSSQHNSVAGSAADEEEDNVRKAEMTKQK
jgi:hypothetical protein